MSAAGLLAGLFLAWASAAAIPGAESAPLHDPLPHPRREDGAGTRRGEGASLSTAVRTPIVSAVELLLPPGEDAGPLQALLAVSRDAPLSRREVRRTVQLLFATGRFANVVARTRPLPDGGVALVLECSRRQLVTAVEVEAGPRPVLDPERVRRSAGLAAGDELWPGRLEEVAARIRALHARHGWRAAEVSATAGGVGAGRVVIRIAEGPPTRVVAVDFGGATGLAPDVLRERLATTLGAVLDLDALETDAREVRSRLRRAGWLRARVGAPEVTYQGEAARVKIPVEAGAHVAVRFAGVASFPIAELRAELGLEAEQALDATALAAAAGRVRAFYLARGYAAARVTARESPAERGSALVFTVDEGRRYRVAAVRFPGASRKSSSWLRGRLDEVLEAMAPQTSSGPAGDAEQLARAAGSPAAVRSPPPLEPRWVWNPPLWDEAALRLVEFYRAEGYLDAAYDGARAALDAARGTVEVEVRLREGVQTLVRAVAFEGNSAVPTRELADEARLGPGDPLAFGNVDATRTALLALYARRGYLYATIDPHEDIAADRASAVVRFVIDEGPRVRVGAVVVSGARRTREAVVRESLTLKTGDVYDPESAGRSQAALLRLGVFRSVGLRLADPEVPGPVKDVTVQLSERPWRTLSPGVGFSLANGPRAFVELVEPNLLGRALELSVRAKANYPLVTFRPDLDGYPAAERFEGRLDIGLHDPRVHVFGLPAGGRIDGIVERLHRPSYDLARASTIFGLDRPVSSHVTLSLQYEVEIDHIVRRKGAADVVPTRADLERLLFPEGVTTLNSIRPVLTVDYRDDSVHPRKGWLATGVADYSHSLGGHGGGLLDIVPGSDVFTHMLRLSGAVSGYLPLGTSVLALSLRGGRVLPLDPASQTIGPKRFFLGGASTMRGYGEDQLIPQDVRGALLDQVRTCAASKPDCTAAASQLAAGQFLPSEGGESFVNAKLELRFQLSTNVEAGIFTDAGNLWLDPRVGSITDVRWNFGAGLRFLTPIGPAVLDLGVNPAADARLGEAYVSPHFSIGLF